jgi:hypothetical protein
VIEPGTRSRPGALAGGVPDVVRKLSTLFETHVISVSNWVRTAEAGFFKGVT